MCKIYPYEKTSRFSPYMSIDRLTSQLKTLNLQVNTKFWFFKIIHSKLFCQIINHSYELLRSFNEIATIKNL